MSSDDHDKINSFSPSSLPSLLNLGAVRPQYQKSCPSPLQLGCEILMYRNLSLDLSSFFPKQIASFSLVARELIASKKHGCFCGISTTALQILTNPLCYRAGERQAEGFCKLGPPSKERLLWSNFLAGALTWIASLESEEANSRLPNQCVDTNKRIKISRAGGLTEGSLAHSLYCIHCQNLSVIVLYWSQGFTYEETAHCLRNTASILLTGGGTAYALIFLGVHYNWLPLEDACGREMVYLFTNHYFLRFKKWRYTFNHSFSQHLLSTYYRGSTMLDAG